MVYNKYFKRVFAVIIISCIVLSCQAMFTIATQEEPSSDLMPISGVTGTFEETNGNVRFVADSEDLFCTEQTPNCKATGDTLPQKYDLRNDNGISYVTSVKNQGKVGTCWSFATVASMESNILKQGNAKATSLNLSERQLSWYTFKGENTNKDRSKYAAGDTFIQNSVDVLTYADKQLCKANGVDEKDFAVYTTGGDNFNSISTLARGYGAEDETNCVYDATGQNIGIIGKPSTNTQTVQNIALKEVHELPEFYATSDTNKNNLLTTSVDAVKQSIYKDGAVTVGYYGVKDDGTYYNSHTYAQYCNDKSKSANHKVTIIGWDDTYSRSNFATKPPKNGAWIVKNSWGTGWGNKGYFYMSYYDKSMTSIASYIMEDKVYNKNNTTSKYNETYQYNGIAGRGIKLSANVDSANIFTARNTEVLKALSFDASCADTVTTLSVYLNPTSQNPTSGTKAFQKTLYKPYAGYYIYELTAKEQLLLQKGTKYSVVISQFINGSNKKLYILCNEAITNGNDLSYLHIDNKSGEAYVNWPLSNGSSKWLDVTDKKLQATNINTIGGANVKAYTDKVSLTKIQLKSYPKKVNANTKFDTNKIKIIASYSSGFKTTVSGSKCKISGYKNKKIGKQPLVLTYTDCNVTKRLTFKINVVRVSQKINCKKKLLSIKYAKQKTFKLNCKAKTRLKYKSDKPNIVSVNKKGTVKIKRKGTVKITVRAVKGGIYKKAVKTIIIKIK